MQFYYLYALKFRANWAKYRLHNRRQFTFTFRMFILNSCIFIFIHTSIHGFPSSSSSLSFSVFLLSGASLSEKIWSFKHCSHTLLFRVQFGFVSSPVGFRFWCWRSDVKTSSSSFPKSSIVCSNGVEDWAIFPSKLPKSCYFALMSRIGCDPLNSEFFYWVLLGGDGSASSSDSTGMSGNPYLVVWGWVGPKVSSILSLAFVLV